MPKEDMLQFDGEVLESLPNAMFRVKLENDLSQNFNHSNVNDAVHQYRVRACIANNSCSPYSDITKTVINRARFSSETPVTTADIPAIESGSASVGSINGSFQTDQVGQAGYSIPLYAGMGTAGLSPKISLNYSSGSGNGPLGVGWSISGVTVITRCRETQESTTSTTTITPTPITWGNEDRLCLNGETLFVASGDYWGDDSTYRTERDQFARIKYSATNNSFTIERKDGSTAYYGDTADSNIKANVDGTTPTYAWVINRYVDYMSNYIDYFYNNLDTGITAGELEFVLTDIDFTGHIGDPANNQDNDVIP
ncbi:MAG: SpvB/TcaC N-terminal domain-containing protein, partial [Planctomycetota bacterium]